MATKEEGGYDDGEETNKLSYEKIHKKQQTSHRRTRMG